MLAREGLVPVAVAAAGAAWLGFLDEWTAASAVAAVCVWLGWLFRDRRRVLGAGPLSMVSPNDGRVARVDAVDDPWLERSATRIRVALPFPGVTMIHCPAEGKVMDFWTEDGAFGGGRGAVPGYGSPNCYATWVRTDEGDDVVVAISSSRPISRFKLDVAPGERIGHGRRLGFVYFASWVDVLLPSNVRVETADGNAVRAVHDALAVLVHD